MDAGPENKVRLTYHTICGLHQVVSTIGPSRSIQGSDKDRPAIVSAIQPDLVAPQASNGDALLAASATPEEDRQDPGSPGSTSPIPLEVPAAPLLDRIMVPLLRVAQDVPIAKPLTNAVLMITENVERARIQARRTIPLSLHHPTLDNQRTHTAIDLPST